MKAALYRITVPDGRAYIGVTKNGPRRRFMDHCRASSPLGIALRDCGRENAGLEVLVIGSQDYLYFLEPKAISLFNTRFPNGMNLATGGPVGRGNVDILPSTRAKMRAATFGRKCKPFSIEHRARMSAAHLGKPRAPETVAKMAATLTGRIIPTETRARMSAAKRGKPSPTLGKNTQTAASIAKMLSTRASRAAQSEVRT